MKIGPFSFDEGGTLVVAELSANHRHKFDLAVETIKAAKTAGADAIKLQTYTADSLTIDCDNDLFKIGGNSIWSGRTFYDLYKEAYTPWEWQPKLKSIAEDLGMICFSSPFDKSAVDFLEGMDVPAYKVASFEIVDLPLIQYIASKRKPVIISTGIATLGEISEAVEVCRRAGNNDIALLKCTSEYPAPYEDVNLVMIPNMMQTFQVVVGLSDHTLGHTVPVAGVALGAQIVEKHFILDRMLGGPDAQFSMEPQEFRTMVDSIRITEKALGKIDYEVSDKIEESRKFSRSLFIVEDVKAGDVISDENVRSIRPGHGLRPVLFGQIKGRRFRKDLKRGTPLDWEMFE